jgi:transcription elongation factor S-II
MLIALSKVEMSLEILRETKIGATVNKVKKLAQAGSSSGTLAKDLVSKWKAVADANGSAPSSKQAQQPSSSSLSSAAKEPLKKDSEKSPKDTPELSRQSSVASSVASMEDDGELEAHYDQLPKNRRQIMDIFVQNLTKFAPNISVAKALAYSIESALNAQFYDDQKAYTAKFRQLSYNLKRNERLQQDVVYGDCPPEVFVQLNAEQLATEEQKSERQEILKDNTMERRSDYYQVMRAEIQKSVGIDPNNQGSFTCKKCKQSKTTHYSLQTRSADEPMTVFVCCLVCGNRWRTS